VRVPETKEVGKVRVEVLREAEEKKGWASLEGTFQEVRRAGKLR